nr:2-C-methyl-D-erythritol 2,4-cyclodiphosphate synthase [Arenimonas sp.]
MSVEFRIGQGVDVHAFGDGDHVVLGGVRIAHARGVLAHSDGDVAIHALCDALLGARALGDIGVHFPPSDPRWKDADSRVFLRHCAQLLAQRGWRLG